MLRSTKIVATLGPSSSESAVLERMIRAGVDVVRLNFSHGVAADHERRAAPEIGNHERVGLDYKELPRDVDAGSLLLLDDGKIVLEVTDVRGTEVHTRVRHGGVLSNNKVINRQGGGLTAPALTSKDMEDIK